MNIFAIICNLTVMFCIFMMIRIRWTHKRHIEWLILVRHRFHIWGYEKNVEMFLKYPAEILIDAIAPFEEMVHKFWIWDLHKFVKNWEHYYVVMGKSIEEEQKLRVVK